MTAGCKACLLMPRTPRDNKNRDFLWALDLKNVIISHQSKQLLAPGAILTHRDTEAECVHTITTPPTSIPVTVPASGCDLSHHTLYPHTPTRHWWLLVHVDGLPTAHALKEPLALCTLATQSKELIIKPLWVPGWSETLLLYYSMQSGGNEPVSRVPSYSDECK